MTALKRILFVDDEPMVLQGLQRMLRPLQADWDMAFVESGARALELMTVQPFEVVVSDMRMPGMNGVELLRQVRQRHPKTIRLILSGHADKDLILQCIGTTHQYLAKPCDPELLQATLKRIANLDASLKNERVQELAAQMDHLPSIPAIYSAMLEKLQDPEVNLNDLGALIARDLGMTVQILRLVNSACFGLHRPVHDPTEAVGYLGVDTVKSLVLSLNVFDQFAGVKIPGFSHAALWSHSLQTASVAKAIAIAEPAGAALQDACFVTGMLHDVGKLVLALNFTGQYAEAHQRAREKRLTIFKAEEQVFGVNHADVGGYLLGLWGLPPPVVEAIALHHTPARSPNLNFSPLLAVHIADALAQPSPDEGTGTARTVLDFNHVSALGFADQLEVWRQVVRDCPLMPA